MSKIHRCACNLFCLCRLLFWQDKLTALKNIPMGQEMRSRRERSWISGWALMRRLDRAPNSASFHCRYQIEFERRIEESWTRRVVESRGLYFARLLSRPLPFELKEEVTRISAEYFKNHPAELNDTIIQELSGFLSMERKGGLA